MIRRALLVALVLGIAFALLAVQNKVLVGSQDLQADMRPLGDRTYEVVFKDLTGEMVWATANEHAQLTRRLAGGSVPVKTTEVSAITGDHTVKVTLAADEKEDNLRQRLISSAFRRPNPPRDLMHVSLGIDLRGGVEFICQLYSDSGQRVAADDEVIAVLRGRLDQRGLTEPSVTRLSNGDVQVVIPGGTAADAARTRKVLETTGRLEFREVIDTYPNEEFPGTVPGEKDCAVVLRPGGGYAFAPGVIAHRSHIVSAPKTKGDDRAPSKWYHLGPLALAGRDVADASRTIYNGRDAVSIRFTAAGAAKNSAFTTEVKAKGDRGKEFGTGSIAIVFDGMVESAPHVREASSTNCVIDGVFTRDEIESLRAALMGGSLSVTPVVLSERVVGATLGGDTVRKTVWSMIWAFVGILAFMGLYYRRLGVVAVLCMLISALLIWASLSIFGATVTLPGLAGLVLSVAMSMDTNVLIYERIREELRLGKDLRSAVDAGFDRAFITILDSNLTTMFTGLILYWVGSGPVKGFGLTLAVGVAVSMFSGVYIGRLLVDLFTRRLATVSMASLVPELRLPYIAWRKVSFALSIVTGLAGIGWFCFGHTITGQGNINRNFDIDFTGGNMVQVIFQEPLGNEQIQAGLASARAQGEAFSLLDPRELSSPQAYYPTLGLGASASRQWVFRGRDEAGADIERRRAEVDRARSAKLRAAERLRNADKPDEAQARILDEEARVLGLEVRDLQQRIAERTNEFKRQIGAAFAGKVAAEGSEIIAAEWKDRTIHLSFATLEKPEAGQLRELQQVLAARDELEQVEVTSLAAEPGVAIAATYKVKPSAITVLDIDNPVAARLSSLFTATGMDPPQAKILVRPALDLTEAAIAGGAGAGLTVAQPFPASEHFSGQVAGQMKLRALVALLIAVVAMLAYIAARFEIGFGVGAVVALFHDLLLTLGLITLLGIRIDLTVVAALLTIIGYSVNDTIVTFDRIRENLRKMSDRTLAEIIDVSVAQTMPRTILTGGATILAIIFMMLFAGEAIWAFNVTLLIGTILGTYSSVFVAAPMLLFFSRQKLIQPPATPDDGAVDAIPEPA